LSNAETLFQRPWDELQAQAWAVREHYHPPQLAFAVPGAKRYQTEHYCNTPHRFASISLTGRRCELQCEHCRGRLLQGMQPAPDPQVLLALGRRLIGQGCQGVLLSGGADAQGRVPLQDHLPAIARLKEWGLEVIVHTGLVDRGMALGLKVAGVDQVLFDVVGDEVTIREVLHLDCAPDDYARTLNLLLDAGLRVAPHVVIGLHYGQLRGELDALEIIHRAGVDIVVLVVLRSLEHTPMASLAAISPQAVGRLAATARLLRPAATLTLGCARPAGQDKVDIERLAILAGVNALAYPDPATVRLADELGLEGRFIESCCTLAVKELSLTPAVM
jgi:uncharacterized radical SAM superfamily protein